MDNIIIDKQQQETTLIDISVPNDNNIIKKRCEKIDKYTNLAIEIKELLWNMKNVRIIPVIIGVNGIIHEHFTKHLNRLHTNDINVSEIQKIVLLQTPIYYTQIFHTGKFI